MNFFEYMAANPGITLLLAIFIAGIFIASLVTLYTIVSETVAALSRR